MSYRYTMILAAIAAASGSSVVHADAAITASLGGKAVMPLSDDLAGSDQDLDIVASKMRVNVKGIEKSEQGITMIGEVEADFAALANNGGSSETESVDVRTGKITVLGSFGAFVVGGRTVSGWWNSLVGPMDLFENGGAAFFRQGSRTSAFLAYATPQVAPGLNFTAALVNPRSAPFDNNDEDIDVIALKADYKTETFKAALGYVAYPGFAPAEDWNRIGFSASTTLGPAALGLAYESTSDSTADADVAGVTASFDLGGKMIASVGFNTILDGVGKDAQAYQLMLKKGVTDKATVWLEYDGFNDDGKAAAGSEDQLAIGLNFDF